MSNSWYVEFLIRNRLKIRSSIQKVSAVQCNLYTDEELVDEDAVFQIGSNTHSTLEVVIVDLDSDIYNDLLIVEKELQKLYKEERMTNNELEITRRFLTGKNIIDVEIDTGISRITISKTFSDLCDRISYSLGGEFTNEGLIESFIEKYRLQPEQIARLQNYLVSNKRHT